MRTWSQFTRWVFLLTSALAVQVPGGLACRKPPATVPAPADPTITLGSPEETARSLLELLRAQLAAVASRDRARVARLIEQTAGHVLAREDILGRFRSVYDRPTPADETLLKGLVENWASIVSYYAAGLEVGHIRVAAEDPSAGTAVVEIPAHGPADEAVLRVMCRRGTNGQWRVSGIELRPPRALAAPPTTQAAGTMPFTRPG